VVEESWAELATSTAVSSFLSSKTVFIVIPLEDVTTAESVGVRVPVADQSAEHAPKQDA